MAKKGTELQAADENTALAMFGNDRPDYITDNDRGSEGVSTDDMSLPRLQIIQDLSPQRKKNEEAYIEGAEEGMVFNSASGELYTKPILFVPCFFRSEYVAWKDRKQGGGFGIANEDEAVVERWISEQENSEAWDISYTHQHFGIMVHPDSTEQKPHLEDIVVSMSRSQLKPSRKFNTVIQKSGGDRFSHAYKLSTFVDESPKGKFYNWKIEQLGYVPKYIFDRAEAVYEAVKKGMRDVSRKEADSEYVDPNDM